MPLRDFLHQNFASEKIKLISGLGLINGRGPFVARRDTNSFKSA
jgi:hypothetical protein